MPPKKKRHSGINKEDCPSEIAPRYPGVYQKNNPNGSVLSKEEFTECAVQEWVKHFNGSDKYENTS